MYDLIRPILFRLDPERAHNLAFALLRLWQASIQRSATAAPPSDSTLETRLFGLTFRNPVGLAAGFDKNGELPHVWERLGFGFAELGTVTARAQPGNPRPRLFRLPADRAVINRMGFNNAGAEQIARGLAERLALHRPAMPVGINLGKSRAVAVEDAAADYAASLRLLFPLADYIAVNVSSPNTPGLRGLQSEAALEPLLGELQAENQRLALRHGGGPRPLLVKLAPDLSEAELGGIAAVAQRTGVAGLIATNTTTARPLPRTPTALAAEAGGLSGAPLGNRSTEVVRILHRLTGGSLPIIGVGGIFDAQDAYEKLRAGASLVQVYTGFVYRGPHLPREICRDLPALLRRDGFTHISQAVGSGAAP